MKRLRLIMALGAIALLLALVNARVQPAVDAQDLLQRAEAELQRGDAAHARSDFELAARLERQRYEPYNGIARACEALRQPQAAIAANESALARSKRIDVSLLERSAVLRNFGLACWRRGEIERGVPALAELHAMGAGTLPTDLRLALGYLLLAKPIDAGHVQAAMWRRYGDIETVWRTGLLIRHDEERAHGTDSLSAAAHPAIERFWLERFCGVRTAFFNAESLLAAGRERLARGDSTTLVRAVLGEAALDAGDLDAAARHLEDIARGPMSVFREVALARLELRRENPHAALAHLRRAQAFGEVPGELFYYQAGLVLQQMHRLHEARAELDSALEANPLHARAAMAQAQLASEIGDVEAVLRSLRLALDIDPRHTEANFELGNLLATSSQTSEAQKYLERYLRLEPQGAHAQEARRLLAGSPQSSH